MSDQYYNTYEYHKLSSDERKQLYRFPFKSNNSVDYKFLAIESKVSALEEKIFHLTSSNEQSMDRYDFGRDGPNRNNSALNLQKV